MSSSPPAESHPEAQPRRAMTLRGKLIAGCVLVIVAVTATIGIVTQVLLSDFLMSQLDSRLQVAQGIREPDRPGPQPPEPAAATGPRRAGALADCRADTAGRTDTAGRADTAGQGGRPGGGGPSGRGGAPQEQTLYVLLDGATVRSGALRYGPGGCLVLDPAQLASTAALSPDAGPVTVTIADAGDYRVAAQQLPGGEVLVTGLSLAEVTATEQRLTLIVVAVGAGALLAGGLLVWWIVHRSLRPLDRVAATARQVTTLPLDRGEVDLGVRVPARDTNPRTEIGQVGSALNQMLGHVSGALTARHESESRVRRFVADASHELRTPLASIRGYAELAGSNPDDLPAVRHALGRVRSESERMSSLVEDLLLLARLDSGRPLASGPVDLTALAVDAVADANAADPGHRWRLQVPAEPVLVTGDEHRLRQVLTNLLANASTHTPPGTVVTTEVSGGHGHAVLTVTDTGEGIAPQLQSEIFGRFVRGDSSRSRTAGSTGLGLSIVQAVVLAHHGSVEVASAPGRTTFTVRLPIFGLPHALPSAR
ncbi:sensor histidine kinase [Nakamurella aerolata]|uniref:histidine kinase n=1 Tax=Nakamurella aerolata TaxID=1656892 RepID=A0A849A447_9ACTN|nr:HAMP domain-containing sensor histidine kinase [Nakamurella aerolata]NNG35325.1 HAMP domain-containing protein [Nakamurella aerolata]